MKKISSYSIVLGLAVLLFTASCGGDNNEAEKKEEIKDTTLVETAKAANENSEASLYALPSPMQIATILKKAGLKYYSGLTNPTDNASKYKNGNLVVKTLGLGTYLSDLSYCILNKQNQESKNYFKTCSQLSESIGLAKAFQDNNVPRRLEKNMTNGDSVSKILSEIQMESDNVLEENKQSYISVIAFTGAWIESMYIGTQVHIKENNANVTTNIVEQMGIAENIIKALEVNKSQDADVTVLLQDLNALNDIYNNFKSVKEIKATDPDVIDPAKLVISVEELSGFTK
ncbi:MAG TPA: hypothetical protein VK835_10605, partial [Bacteroidia bacterium]|nr:hypothetical protein [Bacteroidia bacterium]